MPLRLHPCCCSDTDVDEFISEIHTVLFVLFCFLHYFLKVEVKDLRLFFKFAHKIVCNLYSCMLNWPLALFAASLDILT